MTATWGHLCGTSFSAPVISAIAALALSLRPELTAAEIRQAFIATAVPVAGIGGGRIDAFAALSALGAIPLGGPVTPPDPPPPPPPPAASIASATPTPKPAVARFRRSGTLRSHLALPLVAGTGRLTVTLSLRSTKQCELSVASGPEILLATRRRSNTVVFNGRVAEGRYVIEVSCLTRRPKRYRLSIVAVRPKAGSAAVRPAAADPAP
jgi:Subtilase family